MDDNRIVEQNRLYIEENAVSSVTVTCTSYFSQKDVAIGVKKLLHDLEDGLSRNIHAISALDFSQSLVPVSYIKTPFEAIQHVIPGVELTDSMGTTAQWEQFYQELLRCNGSLDKLFSRYDCADDFEEDIYEKCAGLEFKNWVFYISLKQNYDRIQNDYLAYVVANTDCYEDLRINLLTGIVHIPRSDGRFHNLYTERKNWLKVFPNRKLQPLYEKTKLTQWRASIGIRITRRWNVRRLSPGLLSMGILLRLKSSILLWLNTWASMCLTVAAYLMN